MADDEPTPDPSLGWLGWLGEMTPEEWAEQFAAKPVLARPLVISMDDPLADHSNAENTSSNDPGKVEHNG
jgi:hypothetical protein